MLAIASLALAAFPTAPPFSTDWFVDAAGNSCQTADGTAAAPFCSISEAISMAVNGDSIFVSPGVYAESLNLDADLELIGTGGLMSTIIDATGLQSAVTISAARDVSFTGFSMLGAIGRGIVSAGALALSSCTVSGHMGGGIEINGPAASIDAEDTHIVENFTSNFGAGIFVESGSLGATLRRCTIGDNDSGFEGGGMLAIAPVEVVECRVERNTAAVSGAGLMVFGGPFTIDRCTIAENEANAFGGGIYGRSLSSFTMRSSTVSGNVAGAFGFGSGGGLYLDDIASSEIDSCTITRNDCGEGGAMAIFGVTPFVLRNSIVADNLQSEIVGSLTSGGFNVLPQNSTIMTLTSDVAADDPRLTPLGFNGGLTRTHAPLLLSPCIGVGDLAGAPLTDQRGVTRGNGSTEIGAFEIIGSPNLCDAQPNSTSAPAVLQASGDETAALSNFSLHCNSVPNGSFGYFLVGDMSGSSFPAGTQGELCVDGNVGRFARGSLNEVQQAGTGGAVSLTLDLTNIPTPTGSEAITSGDTRHFQLWYRDANPGLTSNFSSMTTVQFR